MNKCSLGYGFRAPGLAFRGSGFGNHFEPELTDREEEAEGLRIVICVPSFVFQASGFELRGSGTISSQNLPTEKRVQTGVSPNAGSNTGVEIFLNSGVEHCDLRVRCRVSRFVVWILGTSSSQNLPIEKRL